LMAVQLQLLVFTHSFVFQFIWSRNKNHRHHQLPSGGICEHHPNPAPHIPLELRCVKGHQDGPACSSHPRPWKTSPVQEADGDLCTGQRSQDSC
jgi:hypothetical protein